MVKIRKEKVCSRRKTCISFREQERKVSSRTASYKAGIQARSRRTCAILMESRGYVDDILREGSMRAGA